jgi:hypothetical protein
VVSRPFVVALALGAVLAMATPTAASAPALPDLEQVAPYKLRVVKRDGRWYLGFATAVRNVGPGALRLRGSGSGAGAMTVRQLSEDGLQELEPNVGTFRYVRTTGHRHWHFMDFMRYELRSLDVPGVLRDQKQGFCLGDAPAFVDGWCARDKPALTTTDLGIRSGGIDIYEPNVEGQEIAIDPASAPAGRYLLTSRIGQTGVLHEGRTDNNVASTVFELRWPARNGQEISPLSTCIGKGCAGVAPPAPARPPAMSAAAARRLARRALRRTIGRRPSELAATCRRARRAERSCRVRFQRGSRRFSGRVRVWYAIEGAVTRWYYSVDLVRRARACPRSRRCTRRIRRVERLGGTVRRRTRASVSGPGAGPFLCRPRAPRRP